MEPKKQPTLFDNCIPPELQALANAARELAKTRVMLRRLAITKEMLDNIVLTKNTDTPNTEKP